MKRADAEDRAESDERVSNEYRNLANETVPEWIDHKILAEAVAGLKDQPRRSWIREWMRPIAFAATAGLCVAVFLDLNQDSQIEQPLGPGSSRILQPPAQRNASQADSGAALSRAVRESGRQLQQLDAAVNGARPNLSARYCSEKQSAATEAWWDCIVQLRRSGDRRAADEEYRLLVATFPDFKPVE